MRACVYPAGNLLSGVFSSKLIVEKLQINNSRYLIVPVVQTYKSRNCDFVKIIVGTEPTQ